MQKVNISGSNVFDAQARLFVTTHSLIAAMGQEMLSFFAGRKK